MTEPARRRVRPGRWLLLAAGAVLVTAGVAWGLSWHHRRAARAAFERSGGALCFAYSGPEWLGGFNAFEGHLPLSAVTMAVFPKRRTRAAQTARLLEMLQAFDDVRTIDLSSTPVADGDLRSVSRFKTLRSLNLSATQISDAGLKSLRDLPRLESLNLNNTAIDDRGIETLARMPQLKHLYLDGTGVTDEGMKTLAALPELEDLSVSNTQVTEFGLEPLAEKVPGLAVSDD